MAHQTLRSSVRLILTTALWLQLGGTVRTPVIYEGSAPPHETNSVAEPATVEAASVLQSREEVCSGYEAKMKAKGSVRSRRSRLGGRLGKRARELRSQRREFRLWRRSCAPPPEAESHGPPRGEATEEDPWQMTMWDKLNLQGGWILLAIALALAIYAFCECAENLGKASNKTAAAGPGLQQPSGLDLGIFDLLWGQGAAGTCVSACIIVLSVANFLVYIVMTETEYDPEWKLPIAADEDDADLVMANRILENVTLFIFLPITVLRIMTIHCHPDWKAFGRSACWRYVMTDIYIVAELVALGLTIVGFARFYFLSSKYDHVNLMFVFFARSLDMLERSGFGLGVRRLRHLITEDGRLLLTACVIGIVVWLLMSGLYFTANHYNEADDAVWAVATYKNEPWAKFESIPSTMWFVLINLIREHPLASAHETFFSRLWVCVVCIFAMPIFAIPVSILQSSLFKEEQQEAEAEAAEAASFGGSMSEPEREGAGGEEAAPGFWEGAATAVLVFGSLVVYFYYTARTFDHSTFLGFSVQISASTWAVVDMCVSMIFLLEWLYRMTKKGPSYAMSALGIIDLLAWLPGVIHFSMRWKNATIVSRWWQGGSVLRVLKMERYLRSWRDIIEVIRDNFGILSATYLLSGFLWMLFTVVTYSTEATNPDPNMREVFGSGMRSIWAEIINLHGEWPWADYTCSGKAMGVFIGLFSIMLFCVPISIFGDAFTDKIQAEVSEDEGFDVQPWPHRYRPSAPGMAQSVYDSFYAHLHNLPAKAERRFVLLRGLAFFFVGATTVTTVLSTLSKDHFGSHAQFFWYLFYFVDVAGSAFFFFEFVGRLVALGWRHPMSLIGLCDILSLGAFLFTLFPAGRYAAFHPSYKGRGIFDIWDDILVLLRLLRLFSLESYLGALQVIWNVLCIYRVPLGRSAAALVSTWFIHATLLYASEQTYSENKDMQYRYRSILSSLQYSIVHLFGDFPETEYTFLSKVIHVLGILGGMAITGTFCGVFSGCFISYLDKHRASELKQQATRQAIVFMNAVRVFQRGFRRRKAGLPAGLPPNPLSAWKRRCREIAYGMTPAGRKILYFFHAVLLLAILNSLIMSVPEAEAIELTCLGVDMLCTVVFVVEYAIRVAAYPGKAFTFWRVLDLVCCLPFFLQLARYLVFGRNGFDTLECIFEALSMIRALRVLEFQYFGREVTMIGRAVWDAIPQLAIPGYLALCVWIQTSALFMWLENYYKDETPNVAEDMGSVIEAMYWCCIFLTGEWANVDFTYAGSRLCIFYMFFGIAMFSIPVGILVEAVQTTIQKAAEEEKGFQRLMQMQQAPGADPAAATVVEALRRATAVSTVASQRRASAVSRKSTGARRSTVRSLRQSVEPVLESNAPETVH